jgi:hypothetical protein
MDEAAVIASITSAFEGSETTVADGNTFFFTGSDHMFPFATLVAGDEYETVSDLNRPGVYRLNIGVGKETFRAHFGDETTFPDMNAGLGAIPTNYDFAALDRLLPHPVYGRQLWVCILNPSAATFEKVVMPLLTEAHAIGVQRDARRATTAAKRAAQG